MKHKKNPLLDELSILAETILRLLADKDKKDLSNSEKRMLGHIRRSTREVGKQNEDKNK